MQNAARSTASPSSHDSLRPLPNAHSVDTTRASTSSTTQRRLLTLQEIDSVFVSKATSRLQGTTHYTLEVYTSRQITNPRDSNATYPKLSDDEGYGDRQPAYRIKKSLAEFDGLRRALYSASHLAHTYASCEFCKEMILYIDAGDTRFRTSVLRLLVGRDKVIGSLQQFVDDILDMMIHFASIESTPWCSGQVQSHQAVRQFLLPCAPNS
ncbi:hypothetical protein PRNP1_001126 [Phytophthora ramorum]